MTDPKTITDVLDRADPELIAACLELTDPVAIAGRCDQTIWTGKYTPHKHAMICRFIMLGLSESSAAIAAKISVSTLNLWKAKYEQLAEDMQRAAALASAEVCRKLFGFMQGSGPVAFNAVKLYLERRTREFADAQQVNIAVVDAGAIREAIGAIYGIAPQGQGVVAVQDMGGADAAPLPPPQRPASVRPGPAEDPLAEFAQTLEAAPGARPKQASSIPPFEDPGEI